eukprot:414871_1
MSLVKHCFLHVIFITINSQYIRNEFNGYWTDHEPLCLFDYGNHLSSIHNDNQNTAAISTCNTPTPTSFCWFGLNDRDTQNNYVYTDGTTFDYGNSLTGAPWKTGEPNLSTERCIEFWNNEWNDENCNYNAYGICNYPPSPIQLYNDDNSTMRTILTGKSLGSMDILDTIYIEFDVFVHSFPASNASIIHIGNVETETFPAIFINGVTETIFIKFSSLSNQYFTSATIQLLQWYHLTVNIKQDSLSVTLNNTEIFNTPIASHSILFNRTIYNSNPWDEAANVTIKGLIIQTSNSWKPNTFNYLSDYNNRFTDNGFGVWSFDDPTDTLSATSAPDQDGITWLGGKDISTLGWTDYKVEVIFSMSSGRWTGLVFRAQSLLASLNNGQQYEVVWHVGNLKVQFYEDPGANLLAEGPEYPGTAWNQLVSLRVEVSGNTFTVYFENEYMFTYTDMDNTYPFGSIGLITNDAVASFKSLRIVFESNGLVLPPSISPTTDPTVNPTSTTLAPTNPTTNPSETPSKVPTINPTFVPTINPTIVPTILPTIHPTINPTIIPTHNPTFTDPPTTNPTFIPTI